MPIRDIQRRFRELGRLRTGMKVPAKHGKMRPDKLPRYRITSPWKDLIEAAAELYGGTVEEWTDAPGKGRQWQVVVEAEELDVVVPPGQALSQWYELWSGGGRKRQCDGVTMTNGKSCQCPEDPAERAELATHNPPEACKPTTRLSLMLPRIADLGVWRVDAHGYNAAAELGGAAELLESASRSGRLIPAGLRLEHRTQVKDGQTRHFAVPALSFRYTLGETLQALGMGTAGLPLAEGTPVAELPAAEPEPRPALDVGGPAELPPANTDFGVTPPAEEPKLPEQPDEPEAFVPPPPERDEADEPTVTGAQMLAMRARDAGLDDTRRHAVIAALTGGRTQSGKDLDGYELNQAMALMVGYARGDVALRKLDEGPLNGGIGAALVQRDGTVVHATDPALVGQAWRQEPISAPERPGGGTPARQATEPDEASEAGGETPSEPSEPAKGDEVAELRRWAASRRLKVRDLLKAASAVAPEDREGRLPTTYGELVDEPELLELVKAHLEESSA